MAFEFSDGVAVEEPAAPDLYDAAGWRRRTKGGIALSGEIGCALAHHGVWRTIIERGIPAALVLEDDALLDDATPLVAASLTECVRQGDLVQLEEGYAVLVPQCVVDLDSSRRLSYICRRIIRVGSAGYMITYGAARIMAARFAPPISSGTDDWVTFSRTVVVRCVRPAVVAQNDAFPSLIGDRAGVQGDPPARLARIGAALGRPPWDRLSRAWNTGIPLRIRGLIVVGLAQRRYSHADEPSAR
jgi:GR25 family glycosyltransferase involved in LPS biosynthesis